MKNIEITNEIRALIEEVYALPDPRKNLLSHNERELINLAIRLANALRTLAEGKKQ